ncbi:subtilisin family serine protease [Mycoplasmopsis mustelae]|uniref:Subtilisin family serine protease n=1 Tax=Mycoplasmopsis mustelae TaxID=171289 RepID=A0A4R7UD14_9BACT|nr:S8 family serine peptidase [Mycoplasmopsis mustelae]TDV23255.1 subtilisin family serine protease [Mycoplasmopsis mustelae]
MNKKLKKLLWITSGVVFATTVSVGYIYLPDNSKTQKTQIPWYEKYQNSKTVVRENKFNLNSTNDANDININNHFELKLLLNYEFIDNTNNDFIKQKNHEFLDNIKKQDKLNRLVLNYETSEMMPIVWFYFKNENDRESFLKNIIEKNEIFQAIIFPNKTKPNSNFNLNKRENNNIEKAKDPYFKFDRKIDNSNSTFVNFDAQKLREDKRGYANTSSIGILEVEGTLDASKTDDYKKFGYEIYSDSLDNINHHAQEVSMIAAGNQGIDRYAKLYFASYKTDAQWMKAIEWFVEKKGVRVINHSYGFSYDDPNYKYNENNLFLDYISRKYGVVNVFSSGNANDKREKYNEWIIGSKLSFNNLVVGALGYNEWTKKTTDRIADYSNYLLYNDYSELSKPNVVAPGYLYSRYYYEDDFFKIKKYGDFDGTSYAAPIVSGLISTLLREKTFLNTDSKRLQAVKAIIGASSRTPNIIDKIKYKKNGYSVIYGAGIADFEKMLEAADNIELKNISKNETGIIMTSKEIFVDKNKHIKGAISWLFNAGILKNKENLPTYNANVNWWWLLGVLGGIIANSVEGARLTREKDEWYKTHINSERLNLETTNKKQGNNFFTDYDIILQKKDRLGNWNNIDKKNSIRSNDEILEYITSESGTYRFAIKKYADSLFNNSIDDSLALTYTIR